MSAEKVLDALLEDLAIRIAKQLMVQKSPEFPVRLPDPPLAVTEPKTESKTESQTKPKTEPKTEIVSPEPASSVIPVKIEQLMLDLVRKLGRVKVVEILAQYNVKKASELTGDNLKGFRAWAEDELRVKNG